MDHPCRSCILVKFRKLPFSGHFKKSMGVGEINHSDIVGVLEPSSPNGFRCVITFIDDYSRSTYLDFLQPRKDLPKVFQNMVLKLEEMRA